MADSLRQRREMFQALTGTQGAAVGDPNDVAGMLRTVYGTVRRGQPAVDTREAARRLGVSQRTVQRWLRKENTPSENHLKGLRQRSRQAATTKRGRARALRRAVTSSSFQQQGVRVEVSGMQGPVDYTRERRSQQKLTPEEYGELLQAYAEGGDAGALAFLQGVYSEKYVDNWEFGDVASFRLGGLTALDRDDPRAL